MERAECIARAERELEKAKRTLECGEKNGVPQKDLWHMQRTVEYREAVVEALARGFKERADMSGSGWISVEERLPADEKPVLVFVGYKIERPGFYGTLTYFAHDARPHWQHEGLLCEGQRVLLWMPIPKLPGEEE